MLIHGGTVTPDTRLDTDVCVVGAGPAGLTVAGELARRGRRVIVLEAGGDESSDPTDDPALSVGIPYPVGDSRARAVGGTATRWRVRTPAGDGHVRLRALDELDLAARPWVPHSGWPFPLARLSDAYRRARRLFRLPPEPPRPDGAVPAWAAARGLVPQPFEFAPRSVFTADVPGELAAHPDVTLVTHATVVDLRCDDDPEELSAIEVAVAPGHRWHVRARAYVLAAGGIENARLLLTARTHTPRGLGNHADLVGRYFMEHPHLTTGLLWPTDRRWLEDGRFGIRPVAGGQVQWNVGLPPRVVRDERLAGCTFALVPQPVSAALLALRRGPKGRHALRAAEAVRDAYRRHERPEPAVVRAALRGLPHATRHVATRTAVATGRRVGLERYRTLRLLQVTAMTEQVPNRNSRVRLADRRDHLGRPVAVLDWRLTTDDLAMMRRAQELLAVRLVTGGDGRVDTLVDGLTLPPGLNGGQHHLGTTRMHVSPRQGVVDPDGRLHGVRNGYVAGSSVFPTGGYANPTLTIVALACRLADRLDERLR